ncbi:hypothetical protein F4779DRAFT_610814 [Xylariaceae sp. FL0662B]|nr:hypothetical protein F4779DRAFT_610814 [Xylariaceae sp. FL0662B]
MNCRKAIWATLCLYQSTFYSWRGCVGREYFMTIYVGRRRYDYGSIANDLLCLPKSPVFEEVTSWAVGLLKISVAPLLLKAPLGVTDVRRVGNCKAKKEIICSMDLRSIEREQHLCSFLQSKITKCVRR